MKTNLSNPEYQNSFLALIQVATTEIKKLIVYYALHLKSKTELRDKINGIIKALDEKLPKNIFEREKYVEGLRQTSDRMIREFYEPVIERYLLLALIIATLTKKRPETPLELIKTIKAKPTTLSVVMSGDTLDKSKINSWVKNAPKQVREMWSKAKGYPNVTNYYQELGKRLKNLSQTQPISSESGKKPITLWQKAELDIRHEGQLRMIDDLKKQGVRYAWTSSHPDASKRCEHWQGKLFDLDSEHSELSGHRMKRKIDGKTAYCFKEVVNKVDKYGYKNNIIVGFNCRHKLVPYTPNSLPPEHYTEEEIKKEREINAKLREMEREIRYLKEKAILHRVDNVELSKRYEFMAKKLTEKYKVFANENGYAWYPKRIVVSK